MTEKAFFDRIGFSACYNLLHPQRRCSLSPSFGGNAISRWSLLALCLFAAVALPLRAAPAPERKVPRELLAARRGAAKEAYNTFQLLYFDEKRSRLPKELQPKVSDLILWSDRWAEAELPLCKNAAERADVLKAHIERSRMYEDLMRSLFTAGRAIRPQVAAATYSRSQAEIRYFEVTGKKCPPKKEMDGLSTWEKRRYKGETIKTPPKDDTPTPFRMPPKEAPEEAPKKKEKKAP